MDLSPPPWGPYYPYLDSFVIHWLIRLWYVNGRDPSCAVAWSPAGGSYPDHLPWVKYTPIEPRLDRWKHGLCPCHVPYTCSWALCLKQGSHVVGRSHSMRLCWHSPLARREMPQIHGNWALGDKFLQFCMMLHMGIRYSKNTANKVG